MGEECPLWPLRDHGGVLGSVQTGGGVVRRTKQRHQGAVLCHPQPRQRALGRNFCFVKEPAWRGDSILLSLVLLGFVAATARACGLERLEPWGGGSHTYKEQQVEEEEKVLGDFDTACPHPAGPGAPWGERKGEQMR